MRRWLATFSIGLALACAAVPAGALDEPHPEKAAPAEAKTAKPTNTLRWSTASEVDNFGFDVYRALAEDGPFTRMTKKPIAGAGTVDTPQRYVWVDERIDPDVAYFYYVESISMSGERAPFTPVIRAEAKNAPATKAD